MKEEGGAEGEEEESELNEVGEAGADWESYVIPVMGLSLSCYGILVVFFLRRVGGNS